MGVFAAMLIIGWFYFFTVKSSGSLHVDTNFNYYNRLIDGFRAGHLYLPLEPRPELIALPDPYDHAQNDRYRLGDASYFNRHYYLYFGVTPAVVLMWPYLAITGHHMAQATAVLIFCYLGLAAGSGLWLAIRARYFPESAWWIAPVGVLVFGFGSQVLALARRPSVWELPIACAFAFLMLALVAAYRAIHGRRPVLATFAAALCLALAIGARPFSALTAGVLVLVVWHLWKHAEPGDWRRAAGAAIAALAVIGAGLAWYNYARFGSIFEFGMHYQLTSLNERVQKHFSLRFIPYNLRVYFVWPVQWTRDFPFLSARPIPPWPSGYYSGEDLYCLALLTPVLWFATVGAVFWRRGTAGFDDRFRQTVLTVIMTFLPLFGTMLVYFYCAERYMVDFVPTLLLLALVGLLVTERALTSARAIHAVRGLFVVAAMVTVLSGLLASFDQHARSMRETDPAHWKQLAGMTEPLVQRCLAWLDRNGS